MNFPTKVLQAINLFINRVYIPRDILGMERPIVVHISDTPEEIYPYLYRVLKLLEPECLVHTGDLVDNIKLEIVPELEPDYYQSLEGFIKNMESLNIQKIYYVSGNHDQTEKIKSLIKKGWVLKEGTIGLGSSKFYLNHFFVKDRPKADYYLYGHSFEPKSHQVPGEMRLNGLEAIRVISLKSGEMKNLPYPLGTNGFRKMEQSYRSL